MSQGGKRVLITVLVWVGVTVAAVILALLIGNVLGDAADGIPGSEDAPPLYEYNGQGAPTVDAVLFELGVDSPASLRSGSDVSIVLRGENLYMQYSSSVAAAVSGVAGGAADLRLTVDELDKKDIYVSGCFYSAISKANGSEAIHAVTDYEAALMIEAINAGVDEILVLGMPTDSGGIAYASALFSKVRESAPDIKLGAAVDYSGFKSGDAAYLIDSYLKFADFCAIDTRGALSFGTNAETVVSENLFYFERYPLRLLISDMGDADRMAQVRSLNSLGIYNIQSAPLSSSAAG